ncbi:MAG TPA: divergent PAP2 family protein [Anaerolineales bacterium]|nr:divergent PAP2 family protein [Anaerolineales bacterium]HNQ94459.1 divergent PAP2 family protein [Anaerolineales bacterium]HNS62563.1 divergent PAP2 family protein [Anaerolineales bacterium]
MNLLEIFQNKPLIAGLAAWLLAQIIKLPLDFFRTRKWNWSLLITTGGMPSSHSSLMTATTLAIGLYHGFANPLFALGVAITMIVTYDAAGVRQQAGVHAQRINVLFDELLKGHIFNEKDLREVLGHTPLEVAGGILLGIIVATSQWMIWK